MNKSIQPAAFAPASGLVLGFLCAPFLALGLGLFRNGLRFAPADGAAIGISLGLTLVSLGTIAALGTPLAFWLARGNSRHHVVAEAALLVSFLTPPLALGILLAAFYGPLGPLGRLLARLGLVLANDPPAFVLAQVYGALPYYVVAARTAFASVPAELEDLALTLGQSPWRMFWRVSLPLARSGVAAGLALAWVRALGEFGIVLIVAYFPQGIPVKLWVNLQDGGLASVYPLLAVFLLVAMPLPLALALLTRRPLA